MEVRKYYKGKLVQDILCKPIKKEIKIGILTGFHWDSVSSSFYKYSFDIVNNDGLDQNLKYLLSSLMNFIISSAGKDILLCKRIYSITPSSFNKEMVTLLSKSLEKYFNPLPSNEVDTQPVKYSYKLPNNSAEKELDIIYEIVKDRDGNSYAREIRTGAVFPICKKTYEKNSPTWYISFEDNNKSFEWTKDYYFNTIISTTITPKVVNECPLPNINISNSVSYIKSGEEIIATDEEVDNYLDNKFVTIYPESQYVDKVKYKKILFYKKKIEYRECETIYKEYDLHFNDKIIEESKKNSYYDSSLVKILEVKPTILRKKAVPTIEKDASTRLMEDIDILLINLSSLNQEKKKELEKKYNEILNSESDVLTLNPLTIQSLNNLKSQIEAEIDYYRNSRKFDEKKNIPNQVEKNIDDEIDEILKLSDTDNISLDMVDNLYVKVNDLLPHISVINKRNAILKIARLYILSVYKNEYTINDLSNSYFKDNLKNIVYVISNMVGNNEIKIKSDLFFINDINLEYVLRCIKEIEFISKEMDEHVKVKTL